MKFELKNTHIERFSSEISYSVLPERLEVPMDDLQRERAVPVELLRRSFSESNFSFKTTRNVEPLREIIGQERALRALQLGLDIESAGYNIFITGFAGTGRKTTIKAYLEKISKKEKALNDFCYVNNFQNPDMPLLIKLSAGQGNLFKKDMSNLVDTVINNIPKILESEDYQIKKKSITEEFTALEKEHFKELEKEIAENGFALIQVQYGQYTKPEVAPVLDGKAVPISQLGKLLQEEVLSQEDAAKIQKIYQYLQEKMENTFKKSRDLGRQLKERVEELDNAFVKPFIDSHIDDIRSRYLNEKMDIYLNDVSKNLVKNLDLFKQAEESDENPLEKVFGLRQSQGDPFIEFQVNVLVDNSGENKVPVFIENYPTYKNLFGTIERVINQQGLTVTDFTRIKGGSFVRAIGGYIVIDAVDALTETGVWPTLKRILKTGSLEIQNFDPFNMSTTSALKPDPIPIDVKVVMIGDKFTYYLLYSRDEEFKKIFKIKADFDSSMPYDNGTSQQYVSFMKKIIDDEGLLQFKASGVAEIMEFGFRLSERQNKISTKFSLIADLIRESSYWAQKDGKTLVEGKHVEKTLEERRLRLNLVEEKYQEMIADEVLLIETKGQKVGQINGLAVLNYGDYTFGKPSKITCQVSLGRAGFINIEREAKLSGKIHTKGLMIIAGYFRGKYAQKVPLTLSASICFEQSYGNIDGDSASSTEIYLLLSSLADEPINQGIAVTGSVNQMGEIQPIGGVNEKIEGYFDICCVKGLDGTQGVLIPHQNVADLMLRKDIVDAVKEGKFAIYAAKSIDEGIEILTGKTAGKMSKRGTYPRGSIHYKVQRKLKKLAITLQQFGKDKKNNKKDKDKKNDQNTTNESPDNGDKE